MLGFVGLSQSQGDIEKFIMQIIKNDVDPLKIKELFPYIQEDIPDDLVEIIKQVKLSGPIIPESIKWLGRLAGFSASNNWAVSPGKTASGKAMLCGDPHLAIQLPSIWYSALMISQDHYMMGATVPGIPSVVLGRSPNLSWAVTYGTMDMIDYFIEEVKDQKYRRVDKWLPFVVSEEVIKPKKQEPVVIKRPAVRAPLLKRPTIFSKYPMPKMRRKRWICLRGFLLDLTIGSRQTPGAILVTS
jgi:penicillin amidase